MRKMDKFLEFMTGHFDNSRQLEEYEKINLEGFPRAEHVNTVCNDKITGLPADFNGVFVLEESYYTTNGRTNAMPHLFLFTEVPEGIKLTSYEMPKEYSKDDFTYDNLKEIPYDSLLISEKFTPLIYREENGEYRGESVSMFSPVTKFTLSEIIREDQLIVSETFEVNGKRTFGYDYPLVYLRVHEA